MVRILFLFTILALTGCDVVTGTGGCNWVCQNTPSHWYVNYKTDDIDPKGKPSPSCKLSTTKGPVQATGTTVYTFRQQARDARKASPQCCNKGYTAWPCP